MKTALTTLGLGVLALVSLPAAARGYRGPTAGSFFKAVMHGAINESSGGEARFGAVRSEDGSAIFTISLGSYSDRGAILFNRADSRRPGPGIYVVSEEAGYGAYVDDFRASVITGSPTCPTGAFEAESGTITVTTSSDREIKGRFDFLARGFLSGDPAGDARPIRVTGTFLAAGSVPIPAVRGGGVS